jgi:hypothetical protein
LLEVGLSTFPVESEVLSFISVLLLVEVQLGDILIAILVLVVFNYLYLSMLEMLHIMAIRNIII